MKLPFPFTKLKKHTIKIGSGVTPRGGEAAYKISGIPLIRSQNVLANRLDLSNVAFIADEEHEKMSGSKVIPGDVLLNITGASIGRSCIVPPTVHDANVNQHVCIIRLNNSLDGKLLSIYLNSWYGQKLIWSFQGGGSREGLNFQQIGSFDIPLPPLPEQKAIADSLSVWDETIDRVERLIKAKEKRFKWLLRSLIGEKDGWRNVKLGEVSKVLIPPKKFQKEDYLPDGNYPIIDQSQNDIAGWTNDKDSIINVNSSLIIFGDHTCITKITHRSFAQGADGGKILNILNGALPLFVYFCLLANPVIPEGYKRHFSVLKNKIIALPPSIEEQKQIAGRLSDARKEIDILKKMMEKYKAQKRGLMQKMLTGQWRVKPAIVETYD